MSPATSTAAHTTVSGRHITCRNRHAVLPTAPVPDAHKCAMSAPRSSRGAVARGDGGSWGTAAAQGKRGGEGGRPSRARRRSSWRARQWSRPTCLSCSVRLQGGVAREAKVFSSVFHLFHLPTASRGGKHVSKQSRANAALRKRGMGRMRMSGGSPVRMLRGDAAEALDKAHHARARAAAGGAGRQDTLRGELFWRLYSSG